MTKQQIKIQQEITELQKRIEKAYKAIGWSETYQPSCVRESSAGLAYLSEISYCKHRIAMLSTDPACN